MAWEWKLFLLAESDSHLTKDESLNLSLPCLYCMQNRANNNTGLLLPSEGYSENWGDAILEVIRELGSQHRSGVVLRSCFSGCFSA